MFTFLKKVCAAPFYAVLDAYIHLRDGVVRILAFWGLISSQHIDAGEGLAQKPAGLKLRDDPVGSPDVMMQENHAEVTKSVSKGAVVSHLFQVQHKNSRSRD